MANKDRNLNKIIKQIANEENIDYTEWSMGWIIRLSTKDLKRYIYGYNFDSNPSAAARIASDKVASYQTLSSAGVPAVEHRLFLRPSLQEYVGENGVWGPMNMAVKDFGGFPVVVKPNNDSSSGSGVSLVHTQRELEARSSALFRTTRGVALSPYLNIDAEFRAVIVGDDILLLFEKRRNGDWRHNLARGAMPILLDQVKESEISEIAIRTANALGLTFCSVDIVSVAGNLLVLEVNAGIMLETFSRISDKHYRLAHGVYRQAVKQMFLK